MFANSYGFNRGCGCGGHMNTCGSTCGSTDGVGSCGCGCNTCNTCNTCMPTVTPITLPETTNCSHCCMYHEQPLIQPIENRTVRHHNFYPRVYVTNRFTTEEVVEPNTAMNMYGATNMYGTTQTTPLYPNFTNYMNTM